jgi:hypothetical protein
MLTWLDGKKTLIGSLLLSLLGAVWSLDMLIDGTAVGSLSSNTWPSEPRSPA